MHKADHEILASRGISDVERTKKIGRECCLGGSHGLIEIGGLWKPEEKDERCYKLWVAAILVSNDRGGRVRLSRYPWMIRGWTDGGKSPCLCRFPGVCVAVKICRSDRQLLTRADNRSSDSDTKRRSWRWGVDGRVSATRRKNRTSERVRGGGQGRDCMGEEAGMAANSLTAQWIGSPEEENAGLARARIGQRI